MSSTIGMTFRYSTNHTLEDMKVAVLKAGLANEDYRKKQEMGLIFKCGTMAPVALTRTLVSRESLSFFAYSSASARYFMWHAREYAIRHVSYFQRTF